MTSPVLAISIGDPAGIGPEIALKACHELDRRLSAKEMALVLVGDLGTLRRCAADLRLPCPPAIDQSDLRTCSGAAILATEPPATGITTGVVSAEAGEQAYRAVVLATELAMNVLVDGVVTGPLNKEALHLAGHRYAGHTELLAELTGVQGSVMMLAHESFRVSHVTTHCALEDVPKRATAARIRHVVSLTDAALRRLGLKEPRIAIAALNPHGGEGGIFGRQDIDVTAPLVAQLRDEGFVLSGPLPGDTVFVKMRGGAFDAVIAMYHDQGHIPVKLLGFTIDPASGRWTGLSGVNITLGLPIIRTSVDHGTAFDIAGQGIAEATSLIEAIDYALSMSRNDASAATDG